jgi:hypothetical protein
MVDLEKLQAFFNQWKNVARPNGKERTLSFPDEFLRMKKDYLEYKKEMEIVSLTKAPWFNIFKIMGVQRDEIKNSAFLANLLNPDESHGQGLLFLKSFLEYCKKQDQNLPPLPDDFSKGRWIVSTEYGIGIGRFDIFMINWDLSYLYVIENKIDAREQENQIRNYLTWMEKMDCPMQALIFLTVTGHEAISSGGIKIPCFSYHNDIPSWLDTIIPEIKAPAVREVVIQYRDIVSRL